MTNTHERSVLSVAGLAKKLGCRFEGDGEIRIRGFAALGTAVEGDLVFLEKADRRPDLDRSKASAVILPMGIEFDRMPVIRAEHPRTSFFRAVALLHRPSRPEPGVHPTARVSDSARLGEEVSIGAYSVVGDAVRIGDGTVIDPLVSIYPEVQIGRDCRIHSHVSLRERVRLGDRVILHNGVVIGADGFGYLEDENKRRIKIPQTGTVVIEDDVEIGANAAVDRATLGETIIRRGVKIDNLVQVAHNVEVGEDSVLVAQVGVAGSSRIGRRVILSGQVGISDHLVIGDDAIAAAKSGVTNNIPEGTMVSGNPHFEIKSWRRAWASIRRLPDLIKQVRGLQKRVDALDSKKRDEP